MNLIKEINQFVHELSQFRNNLLVKLKSYEQYAIKNNIELWKPIKGYENYEISTKGNVRRNNKILKIQLINTGYYYVSLCKNNLPKIFNT